MRKNAPSLGADQMPRWLEALGAFAENLTEVSS